MFSAHVGPDPIDSAALIASIRRNDCGAVLSFEGNVRSPNEGADVLHLDYESYERVAEPQMKQIIEEVAHEFRLKAVSAVHRIGVVSVGQTALFVGVAAPHREAAYAGCSKIVDRIKAEVAIWKTEVTESTENTTKQASKT